MPASSWRLSCTSIPVACNSTVPELGAWYASGDIQTAAAEVGHHLRRETVARNVTTMIRTYRAYAATLLGDYLDIRGQQATRTDRQQGKRCGCSNRPTEVTGNGRPDRPHLRARARAPRKRHRLAAGLRGEGHVLQGCRDAAAAGIDPVPCRRSPSCRNGAQCRRLAQLRHGGRATCKELQTGVIARECLFRRGVPSVGLYIRI